MFGVVDFEFCDFGGIVLGDFVYGEVVLFVRVFDDDWYCGEVYCCWGVVVGEFGVFVLVGVICEFVYLVCCWCVEWYDGDFFDLFDVGIVVLVGYDEVYWCIVIVW